MAESTSRFVEIKLRVPEGLLLDAELDSVVDLASVELRRQLVAATQDEAFQKKKRERKLKTLEREKASLEAQMSDDYEPPAIVEGPDGRPVVKPFSEVEPVVTDDLKLKYQ